MLMQHHISKAFEAYEATIGLFTFQMISLYRDSKSDNVMNGDMMFLKNLLFVSSCALFSFALARAFNFPSIIHQNRFSQPG